MKVVDLPLGQLREAPWNPNVMDEAMTRRLRESLSRFGLVASVALGAEARPRRGRPGLLRRHHAAAPCCNGALRFAVYQEELGPGEPAEGRLRIDVGGPPRYETARSLSPRSRSTSAK